MMPAHRAGDIGSLVTLPRGSATCGGDEGAGLTAGLDYGRGYRRRGHVILHQVTETFVVFLAESNPCEQHGTLFVAVVRSRDV